MTKIPSATQLMAETDRTERVAQALERLATIHELDFIVRHTDRGDRARVVDMMAVMAEAYLQKYEKLISGTEEVQDD